ncbi:diguanylate cyclase [candidate division KSB1 bacterium]|nr:diguanylate cyclase [candidate division KSB1 bacterium]
MKKHNLLFVDDDPQTLKMLKQLFSEQGYGVFMANSGPEALGKMAEAEVDLVLSDNRMPEMTGVELFEKIKKQYPDAVRILYTAYADMESAAAAINRGDVYKYVPKPFDIDQLRVIVRRALEHRDSVLENRRLLRGLEKKVQERTQELAFLYEIGKSLSRNLDFRDIIQTTFDELKGTIDFDIGGIAVKDNGKLTIFVRTDFNLSRANQNHIRDHLVKSFNNFEKEIVAEEDIEFRITSTDVRVDLARLPVELRKPKGFINIPLIAEKEFMGIIHISSLSRRKYPADEVRLLSTAGNSVAIALQNARLFNKLEKQATRDGLTGIYNRRYFQEHLGMEISRAERFDADLSLLLMDIDFFKRINDSYGHQNGDYVLKEIANLIVQAVRSIDVPARYGGEEFAAILPGTATEGAGVIGERIRKAVQAFPFQMTELDGPAKKKKITVTISMGVSSKLHFRKTNPEELIKKADQALYKAKEQGRNQMVIFDESRFGSE